MRYASFNVLADAYTSYGDYSHVDPKLMATGARLAHIVRQINALDAQVVGLQEADAVLVEAFEADVAWQSLWAQKGRNRPDGCLTLVRSDIAIDGYDAFEYEDGSGHVYQITQIGQLSVANTHIKWAPLGSNPHSGIVQTKQLLSALGDTQPAMILADCNDRPGGPVRQLVAEAGFTNVPGDRPTAIVNGSIVSLDLLAVRGVAGRDVTRDYAISAIPNEACASDHIPLVAEVDD